MIIQWYIRDLWTQKKTPRWLEMILRCICNKLTILWRRWQCFDCRIVFFCCWTDFNGFYYFCKVLYFIYCHYFSIHDTCMIFRLHIFHDIFLSLFFVFFYHLANHWDWLSNYTEWLVHNLIYAPYVIHNKSEFKKKNLNIIGIVCTGRTMNSCSWPQDFRFFFCTCYDDFACKLCCIL